ncbi:MULTISPECIES: autotransporter assembly complex protein TamA [unclassified Acinetobacter]|uniref:autotransporter assembly complex protein TamA n=1 Tax=unclassified Acinetobacter TaxID=196816 RepID=UPI002934D129|nr:MULTISPECIES: BamA/TamA family outer membrane protein [unclassified Acinetobacter]WOE32563.1 BamA/TamA family outer membrane protein [Acinetobacter sp. SAAs470]WOE38038.1 BamA/TamA family outer membrane protein [Acinetobacter sp. SAAs474]
MFAQLTFKKSVLYMSVNAITQWKHTKYLCVSVLLSVVSCQSFAASSTNQTANFIAAQDIEKKNTEQTQTINQAELQAPIPSQVSADATATAERATLKPSIDLNQNAIPDSMQMLQQQMNQQNSLDDFQNIEFEQLGDLPTFNINESMANEIYAVADEAKKEALQYRESQKNRVELSAETRQEFAQIDIAPVNVDHLMSEIQSESNIVMQEETASATEIKGFGVEPDTEETKKPNFFQRVVNLVRPEKNTAQVERIALNIVMMNDSATTKKQSKALEILEDNIEAKLSNYTVEAFEDYAAAVPQLRSLANQAAQAVGYYNATFRFERESQRKLKVFVEPGQPVIVEKQDITFTGAGADLPQFQVIALLPDLQVGEVLNQGLYTQTKQRIVDAASNFGFFDSYWRLHDIKVLQPQDTADINLKFETGNRYKLGNVEFVMSDPNKPFPLDPDVLQAMVPWQDDQPYALWRVNEFMTNLTNSRYFNYTFVDSILPDPVTVPLELAPDLQALIDEQGDEAELRAQLNPQPKAQSSKEVTQNVVNEAQFAGTTNDEQNELTARSLTHIAEDHVETDELKQKVRDQQKIPVIATLNADKLNNVELGLGYGSDTGVRLRSQYRRAIVNRRGHSFDANMEVSQIRQAIDGRYHIPYKNPINDYISLVGGYEREERKDVTNTANLQVEAAVIGADRVIKNPRGGWQHIFSTRYRLDRLKLDGSNRSDFENDQIPTWFLANGSSTQQESFLVGYEIYRVDTNKRVNPTQGFSQSYKVEAGGQKLLNETNLAIANINWKFIFSYGENSNNQFIGRANLGYIFAEDFEKVPYNLRYFAGGDQSIRGFDYKSLSPTENGFKVGGQALAVGSLEYNYQFIEGWRAAVFSDFGNAYDKNFSDPTEYSVGVGLRWASPIGPVRIDVASGISSEDHPIRLHIIIGPQL